MKKTILIKEEKNKTEMWFEGIDRVEHYDGELKLWIEKENERHCVYKCWVDELKYYAIL